MGIPLATTTITIRGVRPETDYDPLMEGYPDDPGKPPPDTVESNVPASISMGRMGPPYVSVRSSGLDGAVTDTRWLRADPCDLRDNDEVTDDTTGIVYQVVSATASSLEMFGLSHVFAELRIVRRGVA